MLELSFCHLHVSTNEYPSHCFSWYYFNWCKSHKKHYRKKPIKVCKKYSFESYQQPWVILHVLIFFSSQRSNNYLTNFAFVEHLSNSYSVHRGALSWHVTRLGWLDLLPIKYYSEYKFKNFFDFDKFENLLIYQFDFDQKAYVFWPKFSLVRRTSANWFSLARM